MIGGESEDYPSSIRQGCEPDCAVLRERESLSASQGGYRTMGRSAALWPSEDVQRTTRGPRIVVPAQAEIRTRSLVDTDKTSKILEARPRGDDG